MTLRCKALRGCPNLIFSEWAALLLLANTILMYKPIDLYYSILPSLKGALQWAVSADCSGLNHWKRAVLHQHLFLTSGNALLISTIQHSLSALSAFVNKQACRMNSAWYFLMNVSRPFYKDVVNTVRNLYLVSSGFTPLGPKEWNVGKNPLGGSATQPVNVFSQFVREPTAYALNSFLFYSLNSFSSKYQTAIYPLPLQQLIGSGNKHLQLPVPGLSDASLALLKLFSNYKQSLHDPAGNSACHK